MSSDVENERGAVLRDEKAVIKNDNSRKGILKRLRAKIAKGLPIIGGGAGTGISAKCEEAGGIDLIVIYNSGRFRMAGRGSCAGVLAYGNANDIMMEMSYEVLPIVKHTPVLAGVNGTDPFMIRRLLLKEIKERGFSGIQNFPTVGLLDGLFRLNLEETGMSYRLEVDMVAEAREMDLLTTPYVFNTQEAKWMMDAGADIVVAHMGCTVAGNIGAKTTMSRDESVKLTQEIVDTCKAIRKDVIVICHGGPIASPDDAQYILERVQGCDGFYGASSVERLPTEIAITEQIRKFGRMKLRKK